VILLLIVIVSIVFITFKILNTESKSEHEKYIEKELERNPDYIDWLKDSNNGRDYKLGMRILKRIERNKNKTFCRWIKKIRR